MDGDVSTLSRDEEIVACGLIAGTMSSWKSLTISEKPGTCQVTSPWAVPMLENLLQGDVAKSFLQIAKAPEALPSLSSLIGS